MSRAFCCNQLAPVNANHPPWFAGNVYPWFTVANGIRNLSAPCWGGNMRIQLGLSSAAESPSISKLLPHPTFGGDVLPIRQRSGYLVRQPAFSPEGQRYFSLPS